MSNFDNKKAIEREKLRAEMALRLSVIRPLIAESETDLEWFDDFVDNFEFELALHVVCDHLIDSARPLSSETLRTVDELHRRMKIVDECHAKLAMLVPQ